MAIIQANRANNQQSAADVVDGYSPRMRLGKSDVGVSLTLSLVVSQSSSHMCLRSKTLTEQRKDITDINRHNKQPSRLYLIPPKTPKPLQERLYPLLTPYHRKSKLCLVSADPPFPRLPSLPRSLNFVDGPDYITCLPPSATRQPQFEQAIRVT